MSPLPKLAAAGVIACVMSCASNLNLRNARDDYHAGNAHSKAGNHQQAAVMHSRSLVNARLGAAEPAAMAANLYAYGRQLALIGEYEQGIEHLEESLQVELAIDPVNQVEVLRTRSVLGRVLLDTGRFAQAHVHLQGAYTLLKALESTDSSEDRLHLARDLLAAAEGSGAKSATASARAELDALVQVHGNLEPHPSINRFTPAAVEARLQADRSPESFRLPSTP